jgi:hypothetical protein
VVYGGAGVFLGSSSGTLTETIDSPTTLTSLSAYPNPSFDGQSVTLSAYVTTPFTGVGTPGGTVAFYDGGTVLGTASLDAYGNASLTVSLGAGYHTVTAVYAGGGVFLGSSSGTLMQIVDPRTTVTSLTSSSNPGTAGQALTFTAYVSPVPFSNAGTPVGTVSFIVDGVTVGTATLDSFGYASFTTSFPNAGIYVVMAVYNGGGLFVGSISGTYPQIINPIAGPDSALPTPRGDGVTNGTVAGRFVVSAVRDERTIFLPLSQASEAAVPYTASRPTSGTNPMMGASSTTDLVFAQLGSALAGEPSVKAHFGIADQGIRDGAMENNLANDQLLAEANAEPGEKDRPVGKGYFPVTRNVATDAHPMGGLEMTERDDSLEA